MKFLKKLTICYCNFFFIRSILNFFYTEISSTFFCIFLLALRKLLFAGTRLFCQSRLPIEIRSFSFGTRNVVSERADRPGPGVMAHT